MPVLDKHEIRLQRHSAFSIPHFTFRIPHFTHYETEASQRQSTG